MCRGCMKVPVPLILILDPKRIANEIDGGEDYFCVLRAI